MQMIILKLPKFFYQILSQIQQTYQDITNYNDKLVENVTKLQKSQYTITQIEN